MLANLWVSELRDRISQAIDIDLYTTLQPHPNSWGILMERDIGVDSIIFFISTILMKRSITHDGCTGVMLPVLI